MPRNAVKQEQIEQSNSSNLSDKTMTKNMENKENSDRNTYRSAMLNGGSKSNIIGKRKITLNTFNDRVYKRLKRETTSKVSFQCQHVADTHVSIVMALNLLIEYLPIPVLQTLVLYLPDVPQDFDVSLYLKSGWKVSNKTLHDYPNTFVENVLPIQNQPSLIVTIGVPGSGKTTWAKIRLGHSGQRQYVIAADDYFDRFNGGIFDPKLLGKAHEWARGQVDRALKTGHSAVANNTNTTLQEMNAYVSKVIFGGLPHKVVFSIMPERNVDVLCKRGLHGVPPKKCKEMIRRMDLWLKKKDPTVKAVLKAGAFRRFTQNTSREVLFTGIFVDKSTENAIKTYFQSVSGESLLCDTSDCHLTLKFMPTVDEVDRLPFGKKVKMKLIGYSVHEYVQCFLVDILDDALSRLVHNEWPHITVSCNRNRCGPQYSNNVLEDGKVVPLISNFETEDREEYHRKYREGDNAKNGGGLVVEGTVGGMFKNPYVVKFESPNRFQNVNNNNYAPNYHDQRAPKRRKGNNNGRFDMRNDGQRKPW